MRCDTSTGISTVSPGPTSICGPGDEDDVVLPSVSEAVITAATSSSEVVRHVIEGADHGLGLFTDEPDYTEEAVETTVSFFASRL